MIKQQIHQDIRKMISNLDEEQKEVVILKYYAGLSFKQVVDTPTKTLPSTLTSTDIRCFEKGCHG